MATPIHIAVVDDDASVCRALARLLRANGHLVDVFASGPGFLASLARAVPECLVLDLHMPEMTGLEVQQQLAVAGHRIPAIVVTAHDSPDARRECLAQGAAAYLVKPLREDALLTAIHAATGR